MKTGSFHSRIQPGSIGGATSFEPNPQVSQWQGTIFGISIYSERYYTNLFGDRKKLHNIPTM